MKNGTLKTIGIFAKQARGLMTRFILENDIKSIQDLEMFDYQNYRYLPSESTELSPVFCKIKIPPKRDFKIVSFLFKKKA